MNQSKTAAWKIHFLGILLFLFIPLVLFLFLRYPAGILLSFLAAILIMFSHRFLAIPFLRRYCKDRCLWCGRTSRPRQDLVVHTPSGGKNEFECCVEGCLPKAKRFFDFCSRYRSLFRIGIFLPLSWYVISMLLIGFGKFSFPVDWNRFIFQFFIASSVVTISFFYSRGREIEKPTFAFPIHNLFLLGIQNTLLVFRYVGIWWIAASLYFLWQKAIRL